MQAVGEMVTKSYPIYHRTIFESFSSIRDTILLRKNYFLLENLKIQQRK